MAPQAAVVSYRLGGSDGVSVEARKWAWALGELGFEVRRVAGAIGDAGAPDDVVVPGLTIDANGRRGRSCRALRHHRRRHRRSRPGHRRERHARCRSTSTRRARCTRAVENTRARLLLRHHDLPWQRRNLASFENEFPPRVPDALHVTVNLRCAASLQARGFDAAHTVHNYFDLDPWGGDRESTRAAFGFADDELVLFHPARAIERKNVPGGVRFAARMARADGSHDPLLALGPRRRRVRGDARARARAFRGTRHHSVTPQPSRMPTRRATSSCSRRRGRGSATRRSSRSRRVARARRSRTRCWRRSSRRACGCFSTEAPEQLVRFLADTDDAREQYFDVNLRRARLSFALDDLPGAIEQTFAAHGWTAW